MPGQLRFAVARRQTSCFLPKLDEAFAIALVAQYWPSRAVTADDALAESPLCGAWPFRRRDAGKPECPPFSPVPFRRIVRELGGVGLATTDLVNARALLAGSAKSMQLIETSPDDRPFAVQIFGSDRSVMCDAARFLEARAVDSIDINMGCPVERITKGGAGAGMMCSIDETVSLVRAVAGREKGTFYFSEHKK